MKNLSRYLPIALFLAFFIAGYSAFMNSKPSNKSARIYKIVREYSPYYIEKTLGGLRIKSKIDKEFKEEPSNEEFFKRFEYLEKEWGQKHLKLNGNILTIVDNNKTLKSVKLLNQKEIDFVKKYYGVK